MNKMTDDEIVRGSHSRKAKACPDASVFREHLRYDENGLLYWKTPQRSRNINSPLGSKSKLPYLQFGMDRRIYLVHRVVFAMHHDWWPSEVDHINGNTRDNRIENLRAASRASNTVNRKKLISTNTSGHTGVYYVKKAKQWMARVKVNGKEICRRAPSFSEAVAIRKELVSKHFDETYNEHLQY